MENKLLAIATLVVTSLPVVITFVVYIVQQQSRRAQSFRDCTKSLFSDNAVEQSTAAILLRGFLKKPRWPRLVRPDYSKDAKNLMVVLLRSSIPVSLQKTLADGFSFVDDLSGQDMQHVNLLGALIKPQSRIKYELTQDEKYKKKYLSFRKADFFYAIIQECSINNVDATGAIFYCAILSGTRFRNCIFKNANFANCDVKRVVFDKDCKLEDARFGDAIGIEEAYVEVEESDGNKCEVRKYHLNEFLDVEGRFHYDRSLGNLYKRQSSEIAIFVSKLGAMDAQQSLHYEAIAENG